MDLYPQTWIQKCHLRFIIEQIFLKNKHSFKDQCTFPHVAVKYVRSHFQKKVLQDSFHNSICPNYNPAEVHEKKTHAEMLTCFSSLFVYNP